MKANLAFRTANSNSNDRANPQIEANSSTRECCIWRMCVALARFCCPQPESNETPENDNIPAPNPYPLTISSYPTTPPRPESTFHHSATFRNQLQTPSTSRIFTREPSTYRLKSPLRHTFTSKTGSNSACLPTPPPNHLPTATHAPGQISRVLPPVSDEFTFALSPPRPLPNKYLNCYFNATSQCLFTTSEFMKIISGKNGPLASKFASLQKIGDPKVLKVLGHAVIEDFGRQKCAHETFLALVNAISKENRLTDDMQALFGVDVEYQLKCVSGHHISTSTNNYLSLSLPLPPSSHSQSISIDDCFTHLSTSKTVDFPCNHCLESNSFHTASLSRLSPILVIHFQRYLDGQKDCRDVNFENIITIPSMNCRYEVYGVVYHSGSLSSGHYYAYVKRGKLWYEVDDSMVREVKIHEGVVPPRKGAYILFCKLVK